MGADQSLLQFIEIKEEVYSDDKWEWSLHRAQEKTGARVSAFVYGKGINKSKEKFVENVVKNLKIIRHPTILKFLAAGRKSSSYVLVTESVQRLESVLSTLSSTEVCAGLYNVIEGLVFLHDKAGLSHNNVCVASIYVSEDGVWKLGGMECAGSVTEPSAEFLLKCEQYIDKENIPPENKQGGTVTTHPGHARDAYAFGKFAEKMLARLDEFGRLSDDFRRKVQESYTDVDPNKRPEMRVLLDDLLFKNDYVEVVTFLKMITVKSAQEKEMFFSTVVEKLYSLPVELVSIRLVPLLLSRFVLVDAVAGRHLLPHLLTPYKGRQPEYRETALNPVLSERHFRAHVVPELYKIFHVRDGTVRLALLRHFGAYVHMFDKETLQNAILPQLLLGVRDINDHIVELSLRAVADLVPILGGSILIGGSRTKLFSEGRPKFMKDADEASKSLRPPERGTSSRLVPHDDHFVRRKSAPCSSTSPVDSPTFSGYNGDVDSTENLEKLDYMLNRTQSHHESHEVIIADAEVREEMDKDWLDWNAESRIQQENSSVANVLIDSDSDEFTAAAAGNVGLHIASFSGTALSSKSLPATNGILVPKLNEPKLNEAEKPKLNEAEKPKLNEAEKPKLNEAEKPKLNANESASSSQSGEEVGASFASGKANVAKKSQRLGAEFDIMAIEIKRKEQSNEIDDIFADMQPQIRTKPLDLFSALVAGHWSGASPGYRRAPASTVDNRLTSTAPRANLAYTESSAEHESAWGDDCNDWGLETESETLDSQPEASQIDFSSRRGEKTVSFVDNLDDLPRFGISNERTESDQGEVGAPVNDILDGALSLAEDDQSVLGVATVNLSDNYAPEDVLRTPVRESGIRTEGVRYEDGREITRSQIDGARARSESDSHLPESDRAGNDISAPDDRRATHSSEVGSSRHRQGALSVDDSPTELRSEADQWCDT